MPLYRIVADVDGKSSDRIDLRPLSARVEYLLWAPTAGEAIRWLGTLFIARDGHVTRNGGVAHRSGTLYREPWYSTGWSVLTVRPTRARPRAQRGDKGEALSVCTDCLLTLANGECGERVAGQLPPLSLLPYRELVPGGGHDDDCNGDCNCDHLGFSRTPCDGCADPLHGDRFRATAFPLVFGAGGLRPDSGRVLD